MIFEKRDKFYIITLVVMGLIALWGILRSERLNRESKNWKHNYQVLQDSVRVINTKYGEVLYENNSLIIEKKELNDALGISKKQVKDYEKKLNASLAYISKLEAALAVKDTIKITEVVKDSTGNYQLKYADKWLSFGETLHVGEKNWADVYDIKMDVPLKVGLTDDYKIFVTSPNPYFNVTSIDGAVIDGSKFAPKPKRFSFGLYGGFGVGYGIVSKSIDVGPQIGVGVTFKL